MAERHRPTDDGFTLVEVIIVVVLLGLVSLVIGFAITTVLRVTPTAESQVSTARSVQGLTVWFPADVASAVASGSNITTAPSSLTCVGSETGPGSNLIEITWTVSDPSPSTFVAAYRLEPGVGGDAVHRYACSDTAGPFTDTTFQTLTGPLSSGTATATPSFDEVALDLQGADGTPIRIEATPRNPAEALPTTTTTPALPPPNVCIVTFDQPTWGPTQRHLSGPLLDKLQTNTQLTMSVIGPACGSITIEYFTGFEQKVQPVNVVAGIGYVTIPKGDSTPSTPYWLSGSHTIGVYNDCAAPCATPPLDTSELDVT